jgi:hypothetical protein
MNKFLLIVLCFFSLGLEKNTFAQTNISLPGPENVLVV